MAKNKLRALKRLANRPPPPPRRVGSVAGPKQPIRLLDIEDAYLRLKTGKGSVELPAVKRLELRYYRNNSGQGIKEFIYQHCPELAYANPHLPLVINRLGTSLISKSPWTRINAVQYATKAFAIEAPKQEKKEVLEEKEKDLTDGEEPTSEKVKPSQTEEDEKIKEMIPSDELYKRALKALETPQGTINHLMEDGTPLMTHHWVAPELVFEYHNRETQRIETTLTDTGESILEKVLELAGVDQTTLLEDPVKRVLAIDGPSGTGEEQPKRTKSIMGF